MLTKIARPALMRGWVGGCTLDLGGAEKFLCTIFQRVTVKFARKSQVRTRGARRARPHLQLVCSSGARVVVFLLFVCCAVRVLLFSCAMVVVLL